VHNPSQESNDDHSPLGPTFHALEGRRRKGLIFRYALRHQRSQIVIVIVFLLIVLAGSAYWNELHFPNTFSDTPNSLIGWLINAQSILNFGTLLVALFVWWGETQEDWENDLPKKLSVFFFDKDMPLIVCRYVWLAGADEIRTWGQQVAKQAQPPSEHMQPNLDFGADVETGKPILLLGPGGEVWKHYSVCFRLTKLNKILENYTKEHPGYCRYQNLAAKKTNHDDVPQKDVDTIPEVANWKAVILQKLPKISA
jgi:hypothetical protein